VIADVVTAVLVVSVELVVGDELVVAVVGVVYFVAVEVVWFVARQKTEVYEELIDLKWQDLAVC